MEKGKPFQWNKPGQPARLAVIGLGVLVTAILVAAVCLRPGQEPEKTDGPLQQETVQTPEKTDDPLQQETVQTPEESTDPTPGPTDPTGESAAQQTEPGLDEATEPSEQAEPTQEDPTEPQITQPEEPTAPDLPQQTEPPTEPVQSPLVCKQYAVFSGAFVEDGSDAPVENVAALLITNTSDRYLDLGQLVYQLDGQEALFRVTGLPAGASAWVLEVSQKTAKDDSQFILQHVETSFRDDARDTLEGLKVESSGTVLRVTNNREQTLRNVTLYYKVRNTDGNYFGGITYMVNLGDLEPGQSAEKLAGHFREGQTDIVRIGYQEDAA